MSCSATKNTDTFWWLCLFKIIAETQYFFDNSLYMLVSSRCINIRFFAIFTGFSFFLYLFDFYFFYHISSLHFIFVCFIVTTPTQPQLNSTVGYDTKMTLIHHHPPPTTHTNSMSAISQLLLTRFQPNFKVMFLAWTTTTTTTITITTTTTTTLTTTTLTTSHLLITSF